MSDKSNGAIKDDERLAFIAFGNEKFRDLVARVMASATNDLQIFMKNLH